MSETRSLSPAQERILDLVSYLAVNLVDHPDAVRIDLVAEEDREVFRVHLHPDDQGQFIGKSGQTARAIRTLLTAINARSNQRFALEIVDGPVDPQDQDDQDDQDDDQDQDQDQDQDR